MSTAIVLKSQLKGTIEAPSSKSVAHRIMICAALSRCKCYIKNVSDSDDMVATIGCLESLGAKIIKDKKTVYIDSTDFVRPMDKRHFTLNCKESGTTLRVMIPICAALGLNVTFVGEGRLPKRPLDEYFTIFDNHSVSYTRGENYLPLTISGKLSGDVFEISPKISSQYVTGLLLALSLIDNDTTLKLSSPLLGSQYVDITLDVMRKFSVDVKKTDDAFYVKGKEKLCAKDSYCDENIGINVEGDWSQAAFFLCAGAINGDITVTNLNLNSYQGDKAILDILKAFSAHVDIGENCVSVKTSKLKGTDIDATDTPDLVPVVAMLSCFAKGDTNIFGVSRLKFKESDRLLSTSSMIKSLGGDAMYTDDCMTIKGDAQLSGGTVDSFNDHRIVMAACVGAIKCENKTTITKANAVNKSYSDFFDDYKRLGGIIDVFIR
ncbi:MAG: 3-phosphoshikimate 1-carboxyvinyltransferase [Ruminococcus sp.]|nr:3-phosphoshikimate 1-carboxyvinyltransferase [Ruminococcus sp.]